MARAKDFNQAAEAPSRSDVQAQLERILASGDLRLPDRARRFLRYVVEETLSGRSESLKAYTIAQTIFGRRNFDPQGDPAVRIEAGRIRRELERFYLLSRQREPILITIPKGGYAVSFCVNPECDRTSAAQSTWNEVQSSGARKPSVGFMATVVSLSLTGITTMAVFARPGFSPETLGSLHNELQAPTVVVELFDNAGRNGPAAQASRFLRDEIIVKLVAARKLTVVMDPNALNPSADGRYILQGSVRANAELIRLTARLVREADGAVLWSDNYNLDPRSKIGSEEAVAIQVAQGIFRPLKISYPSPPPKMSPDRETGPENNGARVSGVMNGEPQSLARNMGRAAILDWPY